VPSASLVEKRQNNSFSADKSLHRTLQSSNKSSSVVYRMVAFGSSRTYGSNIDFPERKAYPALLGAKNLGIRASGPAYPAMCTYSMLGGTEVYDVFILEFVRDVKSGALGILIDRLRQRFPKSTIILLDIWAPRQYYYIPGNVPLDDWARSKGLGNRESWDKIIGMLSETKSEDWNFIPGDRQLLEEVGGRVGAHIIDLEVIKDPLESMRKYGPLYTSDMTHFSEAGHMWVRDRIVAFLAEIGAKRSDFLRSWYSKDYCSSWYQTGILPNYLETNMELVEFSHKKFALEARDMDAKIKVNNAWRRSLSLYVSFMATGPHKIYPDVHVWVNHQNKSTGNKELSSLWKDTPHGLRFHVVTHERIGTMRTDNSTIHFFPKSVRPKEYFRVVGIILTAHNLGESITALF